MFSNVSNVSVLYYDGNEMHSEQFIVVDLLCGIFIYIYIYINGLYHHVCWCLNIYIYTNCYKYKKCGFCLSSNCPRSATWFLCSMPMRPKPMMACSTLHLHHSFPPNLYASESHGPRKKSLEPWGNPPFTECSKLETSMCAGFHKMVPQFVR